MYWTLELASKLEDAPWPATKEELLDYAMRSGSPMEVIENLQEMEDEGEVYESIGNKDKAYHYATFRDGLHEMVLCEKIWESSKEQKWVEVPQEV